MNGKWITRTRLRRMLRRGGCWDPGQHVRDLCEGGRARPCYDAHRPTYEDEVYESQRWFNRVRPGKRVRLLKPWTKTSTQRSHPMLTRELSEEFSPVVGELAYRSTYLILREPEDTDPGCARVTRGGERCGRTDWHHHDSAFGDNDNRFWGLRQ